MDWLSLGMAAVTGLFGGGLVWGATQSTIKHHDKRLEEVEEDIKGLREQVVPALARLEGKMDILVSKVVLEKKD